jgi:hypothetical protein
MGSCATCKHWNGRRTDAWGDCQVIVGQIQPELYNCVRYNDTDELEEYPIFWTTPFDPHDYKYFAHNKEFKIWWQTAMETLLPLGSGMVVCREKDLVYDRQGGQQVLPMTIVYYETHRDFEGMNCYEEYKTAD